MNNLYFLIFADYNQTTGESEQELGWAKHVIVRCWGNEPRPYYHNHVSSLRANNTFWYKSMMF